MKYLILSITLIVGLSFMSCGGDDDSSVDKHVNESHNRLSSPTANAASDVKTGGFTANWSAVSGANEYDIDIGKDANFSSITKHAHGIGGTSTFIDGLDSNTEYFYRIKAFYNGSDGSGYSNTISVLTLLGPPVATDESDVTSSSFKANWNPVSGISDYLLFVSKDNPPTEFVLDGKEVTGTSYVVEGLDDNTPYYYYLKAKDGSNVSEESNIIGLVTSFGNP